MDLKHYKVIRSEDLSDIRSKGHLLEHESGARVVAIKNDDDNKAFYIGFRTPVHDSTGVPHILEHSVLNGSKKYPLKEPFMELIKGSLNTFLNAMTYPDKTVYPVASRNDKDFYNLMDVYLDAVLYPLIYRRKEVFLQEGWHYEIFDREEPLHYKGVVYNEMRGAYSDPHEVVYQEFTKNIFPDTSYAYSSGGDPYIIPELTYDDFLDFHQKYYHPSNSYIYLYGDGNLEEELRHIHEFLKDFKRISVDSMPKLQEEFDEMRRVEAPYSLSTGDDPKGKDYLLYGVKLGEKKDLKEKMVRDILCHVLFASDASPIKKRLLDAGIGEDMGAFNGDGRELTLGFLVKNTDASNGEKFLQLLEEELKTIVEKGLNKQELLAAIEQMEFSLKETGGFPVPGLVHGLSLLDSWIYDDDPFIGVRYQDQINELKELVSQSYFEEFIQERILDNPTKILLQLKATPGLTAQKDEALKEELEEYKKSISLDELDRLISMNERLKEYQNREDTEEEKQSIPQLSLDDIKPSIDEIPREEQDLNGAKILYHDLFTGKILYLDMAFDLSSIEQDEIPYATLLSDLMGLMSTKNYCYEDLITRVNLATGGISIFPEIIVDGDDSGKYHERMMLKTKINKDRYDDAFRIIEEFFTTSFEDKKRIKELLQRWRLSQAEDISNNGHSYGSLRASSFFSDTMRYKDELGGISYLDFLNEQFENFDENIDDVIETLKNVFEKVFTKNNLIISVTTDKEEWPVIEEKLKTFLEKRSDKSYPLVPKKWEPKEKKEGIQASTGVNYVCMSEDLTKFSFRYKGSMEVVSSYVSNEFLYQKIRAQGGAYGQGFRITKTGRGEFLSYRDPNLKDTVHVYKEVGEFLSQLQIDEDELRKHIIGTVNRFDPPLTPRAKGSRDLYRYIAGRKHEQVEAYYRESLETKLSDFHEFGELLQQIQQEYLCVIGSSESIDENQDLFTDIRKL